MVRLHALDIQREIYICEDHLSNIGIVLHARKVFCLPAAIYVYRDNEASVWHSRKWSLEYEEMRNVIKNELGDRISKFNRHGISSSYTFYMTLSGIK